MSEAGLTTLGDDEVHGLGAYELDVGARGIEMSVVRNNVALLAGNAEQNAFCGPALMRGNHVTEAEDVLDRIAEVIEAPASRVALVAFHDAGPLMRRHGARAGIGEQIDEHVVSGQQEQVVISGAQQLLPLLAGGPGDRLDALDAEGFDDGFDGHGGSPYQETADRPGRQ